MLSFFQIIIKIARADPAQDIGERNYNFFLKLAFVSNNNIPYMFSFKNIIVKCQYMEFNFFME